MFFLYSSMRPVKLDTLFLCCQRTLINRHLESPLKLSGNTSSVSKGSSLGLYIANTVKFNRVVSVRLRHFNNSTSTREANFPSQSRTAPLCVCHHQCRSPRAPGGRELPAATGASLLPAPTASCSACGFSPAQLREPCILSSRIFPRKMGCFLPFHIGSNNLRRWQ